MIYKRIFLACNVHPIPVAYETWNQCEWLVNPYYACSIFLHIFGVYVNSYYAYLKVSMSKFQYFLLNDYDIGPLKYVKLD